MATRITRADVVDEDSSSSSGPSVVSSLDSAFASVRTRRVRHKLSSRPPQMPPTDSKSPGGTKKNKKMKAAVCAEWWKYDCGCDNHEGGCLAAVEHGFAGASSLVEMTRAEELDPNARTEAETFRNARVREVSDSARLFF